MFLTKLNVSQIVISLRSKFHNFDSEYLSVLFAAISENLEPESLFDVLSIIAGTKFPEICCQKSCTLQEYSLKSEVKAAVKNRLSLERLVKKRS